MNIELQINTTACLVKAQDFGVTHVHNVCTGTIVEVPWGSVNWAGFLIFALAGVVMLSAALISMWRY